MAEINIDVSGLSRLGASLNKSGGMVGELASLAVRKSGADVEKIAKQAAPVDTGFLRNSIHTTVTGSSMHEAISVEVGPSANYGGYVEYGTSRMRPQPYMGPAFDKVVPGFVEALKQAGEKSLR